MVRFGNDEVVRIGNPPSLYATNTSSQYYFDVFSLRYLFHLIDFLPLCL